MDPIPNDVSQFRLTDIFELTAVVGVAAAVWSYFPLLTATIGAYLVGYALLFVADSIDNRPIDERVFLSQALNTIGVLMVSWGFLFSTLLIVGGAIMAAALFLAQARF